MQSKLITIPQNAELTAVMCYYTRQGAQFAALYYPDECAVLALSSADSKPWHPLGGWAAIGDVIQSGVLNGQTVNAWPVREIDLTLVALD